jgi:uncharacterized membrane protein
MNDLERALGRVLRVGVTASAVALMTGFLIVSISGTSVVSMRLLTLGVLVLIATPVARVFVSAVSYVRGRDWMFAILTLIVLAELVASIAAAIRG